MKRFLSAALVSSVLLANVASGATISIGTSDPFPQVGNTFFITVTLTVAAGETAPSAELTLGYDSSIVGNASVDTGVALLSSFDAFGPSGAWTVSALQGQCDQPERCRVVSQFGPNPSGSPADAYTSQAVLSFTMDAAGMAIFDFPEADFFGAEAPTLAVTSGPGVPEPGTAGLLAAGLGVWGWRRRSRAIAHAPRS